MEALALASGNSESLLPMFPHTSQSRSTSCGNKPEGFFFPQGMLISIPQNVPDLFFFLILFFKPNSKQLLQQSCLKLDGQKDCVCTHRSTPCIKRKPKRSQVHKSDCASISALHLVRFRTVTYPYRGNCFHHTVWGCPCPTAQVPVHTEINHTSHFPNKRDYMSSNISHSHTML